MLCFPGAKRCKTARHNLRARTTSSNGKTDGRRHFVATFVKPNQTAAAQDNLDCNWTSNRPGGNYAFCCSASLGNWPFRRNYCTYFPPVGRTRCTVAFRASPLSPPVQSYYEVIAYPGIFFSLGLVCSTPLLKLIKKPLGRCDVVSVNEVFQVKINAILKILSIEKGLKKVQVSDLLSPNIFNVAFTIRTEFEFEPIF
jgi:hypothetical protein